MEQQQMDIPMPNTPPPAGPGDDSQEIDLLDLLAYYMGRLPLLVAAILIGALLGGVYTRFFIPDRYTAVSKMYMISASSDSVVNLADLNIGSSLSNDYVELMMSRPVLEDIIEQTGLDYTYEQLAGMINLSIVSNTRIVKISATSTDPREAMEIANQLAMSAKIQLPLVMDAPKPSIVENAVLPQHKSSPSMSKNVIVSAMLALVLVLGVLTVFYLLDDTIKTAEQVESEFGVLPLTVIPEGTIEGFSKKDEDGGRGRSSRRKKKKKKKSGKGGEV